MTRLIGDRADGARLPASESYRIIGRMADLEKSSKGVGFCPVSFLAAGLRIAWVTTGHLFIQSTHIV